MSSKYQPRESRVLTGDVGLTSHAIHRFKQRTPHDCDLSLRECWQLGEDVPDPAIVKSPDRKRQPTRARVYIDRADWGVIFVVRRRRQADGEREPWHQPSAVTTVLSLQGVEHEARAAYLRALGPHGGADE